MEQTTDKANAQLLIGLLAGVDRAMREHDHEHDKRDDEDSHQDDGDTIEVLLDDARTLIGSVHARCDHVRNTRSLARMEQDEDDKPDAREHEQD